MTKKLAIFSPSIGGQTNSFIRRHIDYFNPGDVVVMTNRVFPPGEKTWDVRSPVYVMNRPDTPLTRLTGLVRRRMGVGEAPYADAETVRACIAEHNVGAIWGHYLNSSWPLLRIANAMGIPFFVHALGYDASRMFRKSKWRRRYGDYRHAAGVIVLNRTMRERLVSVGVAEEKIHIIPCGVEVPDHVPAREAGDRVRCLAVGRMVGKKAPLKLLEAFRLARLSNPKLHLDYIGSGPLFEKARHYVDSHGLRGHVVLHGGLPHQQVVDFIRRADLFLQHSIVDPKTGDEEGMPVVILEAMAQGLPVVSTRHAGIPEAVLDGITGYVVEEGDAPGMARRILELAEDAQKRIDMGKAGLERVRDHFTRESEMKRLVRLMGIAETAP